MWQILISFARLKWIFNAKKPFLSKFTSYAAKNNPYRSFSAPKQKKNYTPLDGNYYAYFSISIFF